MPSNHPRCVQHGLVVATDNMCVLCRKAARESSQPPKKKKNTGYTLPLTAAQLTAGGSMGVLRVVGLLGSLLLLTAGAAYILKMPHAPPTAAQSALRD